MNKCIIIGDGPSRNLIDMEAVKESGITTIGTHRCTENPTIVPNYVVWNDPDVAEEQKAHTEALRATNGKPLVLGRRGAKLPLEVPCERLYDLDNKHSYKPLFGTNIDALNLYTFNTGTLAIQLAHVMGAKKIGIVGMDLYYSDNLTHYFGDGRPRGASDAMFHRAVEWFTMFSRRFRRNNPRLVMLWQDELCPLTDIVDYESVEDFITS